MKRPTLKLTLFEIFNLMPNNAHIFVFFLIPLEKIFFFFTFLNFHLSITANLIELCTYDFDPKIII